MTVYHLPECTALYPTRQSVHQSLCESVVCMWPDVLMWHWNVLLQRKPESSVFLAVCHALLGTLCPKIQAAGNSLWVISYSLKGQKRAEKAPSNCTLHTLPLSPSPPLFHTRGAYHSAHTSSVSIVYWTPSVLNYNNWGEGSGIERKGSKMW